MDNEINYLDLFSGCGGFSEGLIHGGFKFKWHGWSEIDRWASAVYRYRYPKSVELGAVESFREWRMPARIHIVTFGFPCQDLSVAGKRGGLKAKRSGLFFKAIEVVRYVQPDVFILENVKGLFSSGNGRDFEIVLREIADLGVYECEWQLLNTRWFLPQNRERIYLVGHLGGRSRFKVFPVRETDGLHNGIGGANI